jgi:hypothetical protein
MNLAIVTKDRTAAERSRRYRERRKLRQAGVSITRPVTVPTVAQSKRHGILQAVLLCTALAVAAVSGGFSIVGLTAIFAGSFWPVIGMGAALETAKLSAVSWLGRRNSASRWLKGAIVTLVVTLMSLSAVGSYGYLAKARIAHEVAGEAQITAHQAQSRPVERLRQRT